MDTDETIFDKIIKGDIPIEKILDDDEAIAIKDINPVAPTHILVIPKKRGNLSRLSNAKEEDKALLGSLLYKATVLAKQYGLEDGYRIVINDGPDGAQSVYHLHIHLIGGKKLGWPPYTL